jgi:TldD protein
MKRLVSELEKEFSYVSILGSDTTGRGYRVMKRGSDISDSMWSERGFVVRVFNGISYSEYSFNEFDQERFDTVLNKIKEVGKEQYELLKDDIEYYATDCINEELITSVFFGEVNVHPNEVTSEEKMNRLSDFMNKGLSLNDQLIDFRANYEEVEISKTFVSSKKDLEQTYIYTTAALIPIANKDGQVKYAYKSFSGMKGVELLDEVEASIQTVIDDVIELLDAEKIVPGEYEIICDPDVTGLIAHEAFGHGVEMDMFVKDRAKGAEFIEKEVASKELVMHDGAKSEQEVASFLFDDEGVLGTDTVIIKDSLLQSGISDLLSALRLGTIPTGNGRRESFERKAYARMTNTFFAAGDDKLEDMISSVSKGYLLEGFFSGMEDPKNWGIQCILAKGREIVDGKLTGKVVSPVMLTGYVPDLLKSISMISDGLELSGSGACGKGYKEWAKTSTGGSYIKAVGRLG